MRTLTTLLIAGLLALTGVLAPASAAQRTDRWDVPRHATITIKGHGYGHGHGLSQYGAEGAARKGRTARQIVRFYYPHTRWGTSGGRIKVLISADTTDDVVVAPRHGLTVSDTVGGKRRELPRNHATRWRVTHRHGQAVVAWFHRRWHRWDVLRGNGVFAAGGRAIRLMTPSGDHAYRGRLRSSRTSSGRVTVNNVSLQGYLKGVVPLEMPASWHRAAVRAQAVAARTYASYERRHATTRAYQICDTTSCQVYGGHDAEQSPTNRAVRATARQIVTSGGAAAFTQFGSSSGGWTAAGGMPYLPAKRDPYDGWSGNPVHSWSTRVRDARIEHAWPRIGDLRRIKVRGRDGHGDWGGRVSSVRLVGKKGRVAMSGDTFRSALGLRSTWVTFRINRR